MPPPRRPDALVGCVFRARDVLRAGLLTPDALRSNAWRRLFRGVYADARLPDDFGVRIRGAGLLVPPEAAFSGRTAAYLHGATGLVDAATPVEVSLPAGCRFGTMSGMRVRRVRLTAEDVVRVHGRRCTGPVRTALDIARREPLLDSVVALDVLLSRGVVASRDLQEAAAAIGSLPGVRRAARAIDLADGRAESPPESRVRVLLALAGLVAVPQFVVRNGDGVFVARVDLAFPDQRVAVEYDGAWHGEPGQFARDRRRLNALAAAGWRVVHVTAADLRDVDALIARVRDALARPIAGK